MNWIIIIYNNITYCLATVILLSTVIYSDRRKYITAFILIAAAGLLLTYATTLIMPVNVVILTLYFTKSPKALRQTFCRCLTAVTVLWCCIALVTSITMLVVPNWQDSAGYNFFVGGLQLAAAAAIKANGNVMDWCRKLEHEGYVISLEIAFILFLTFVLPLYYPPVNADSVRLWGIFYLSVVLSLAIVVLIINRMKDLDHRRQVLESKMAHAQQIQSQYEKVVTLKHYYSKLYHSQAAFIRENDMEGLREYFEKYIAPIQQEQIESNNQLLYIKNKLIRNLLEATAGQASAMENIKLEMEIWGNILIPGGMELDVFEIISNLIDNSMRELAGQDLGLLRIGLNEEDARLSVQIANTISGGVSIEQLYASKEENIDDGHGYGLKRVREIVRQYQGTEHFTFKKGTFKDKDILIQQINIRLEGG